MFETTKSYYILLFTEHAQLEIFLPYNSISRNNVFLSFLYRVSKFWLFFIFSSFPFLFLFVCFIHVTVLSFNEKICQSVARQLAGLDSLSDLPRRKQYVARYQEKSIILLSAQTPRYLPNFPLIVTPNFHLLQQFPLTLTIHLLLPSFRECYASFATNMTHHGLPFQICHTLTLREQIRAGIA